MVYVPTQQASHVHFSFLWKTKYKKNPICNSGRAYYVDKIKQKNYHLIVVLIWFICLLHDMTRET